MAKVNSVARRDDTDDEEEDEAPRGRTRPKADMPSFTGPGNIDAIVAAVMRRQQGGRSNSRDRTKVSFKWGGGCHECGADHFKKDCPKWIKLMKENNDRMSEGHINAHSNAATLLTKQTASSHALQPKQRRRAVLPASASTLW